MDTRLPSNNHSRRMPLLNRWARSFWGAQGSRHKLRKIPALIAVLCAFVGQSRPATMVQLDESSTLVASPLRIGINNSTVTNYDAGQVCKNWLCNNNPSFQGTIANQVVSVRSGTATTFTGYNVYDLAPAGIWTGASFSGLASPALSGLQSVSGTITGNTAANCCTSGPVYARSTSGAAAAFGDYVRLLQKIDYTPGGSCDQKGSNQLTCTQGWFTSLSGGAVISAQNGDLPPASYDLQTLTVDTTASGASAAIIQYPDNSYTGKGGNYRPMWSGTSYTMSMKCKTRTGTATVTFMVQRLGAGGQDSAGIARCTNSWSTVSLVFTGTETASSAVAVIKAQVQFAQGAFYEITDMYLGQTSYSPSNPTIYTDSYIAALKAYGGDSLRLWDSGVGDTFDDMITPAWGRHFSFWAQGNAYFSSANTPATGYYDHLLLCQTIAVKVCSMVVPAAWTIADYQHLIEFIAGTSGVYPSKRDALDTIYGRAPGPFTSVIPEIIIELTDEPWNTVFSGENMPDIGGGYGETAYGVWAYNVFNAIKNDSAYTSSVKLAINCQSVNDDACQSSTYGVLKYATNADIVMLSNYFGGDLNILDTLQDEFNPQSGFAWSNANDSTNGWLKRWANGMTSHSYPQTLAIYEGGYGVVAGTATKAQLAAHNAAMIQAPIIVQGYMETMKEIGITIQNVWQSAQDLYGSSAGNIPIWGVFKDPAGGQMAGQGNYYFRQVALGFQLANQCIGAGSTMYKATVTGATLYSTSAVNGWPAWTNLPYLSAYAFKNGDNRCLLFANTDPVNPATVSITGANAPSIATENLLRGAGIMANNEGAIPGVTIQTTSGKSVAPTYTIPPYSVSAIFWAVSPREPRRGN